MSRILAIDLGKNKSVWCDYDPRDGTHRFGTLSTDPRELARLLTERPGRRAVIEIGPQAGWVCDLCRSAGVEVKAVHAGGEAWKWSRVKNKSDRDDALKLARMEAMGLHRPVHVPSPQVRQWRELIACRAAQVSAATACRNRIRAILDRRGDRWPAGKKGWTRAAMKELRSMARPLDECGAEELWRGTLEVELSALERTLERIEVLEKKLDATAESNERVRRLRTVPGVGARTAEMVVATLDDPGRFKNARELGCYAGLTPRRLQSGQMDRQTGISRAGSGLLRKLLVQSAWIGQRHNAWMKEAFERIGGGKKERRKKAIVAVARRLFVRLWAMDRDRTDWREPAERHARAAAGSAAA